MTSESYPFKSMVTGRASGPVLYSEESFSLTGEFNAALGTVANSRSRLFGEALAGSIFLFPFGRGSSCTSAVLAEAVRLNTAPAAIINVTVEPILVVGALIAESLFARSVPILSVSRQVFAELIQEKHLLIDTEEGLLTAVS